MIEEYARVIAVNDDNIVVQTTVKSTCSGCEQLDSCGSGQVAKAFGQKHVNYQLALPTLPVNVGDEVLIGLSEHVLLSAAWQVYLWPLIGLFVASVFGQYTLAAFDVTHELFSLLFGLVGGYIGYKCAQYKQKQVANDARWRAQLLRVGNKNNKVLLNQTAS
ncbi:SoxR reducing system RseC family protein [Thalassotalea sediminis]|uniref:SoxR reducing system RseC family protein n=1 Tax=Thalassotalea sediminis TaxID=1759089 RepID=UPI0025740E7C|nr:SoxR reducing system RseC family protein [Thalassotalea sediminis]